MTAMEMDVEVPDREKPVKMQSPTAMGAAESVVKDRIKEVDGLIDQHVEKRESINEQIAILRGERHTLTVALHGFERARNPRTRKKV